VLSVLSLRMIDEFSDTVSENYMNGFLWWREAANLFAGIQNSRADPLSFLVLYCHCRGVLHFRDVLHLFHGDANGMVRVGEFLRGKFQK
jgi:hypothetical protein